jgi:acetyltransferase-like isoleucine patch superfamily enzyme
MTALAVQALLRIKYHPAFATGPAIGGRGYAMPLIDQPLILPVDEANRAALADRGITLDGTGGDGSVIVMDARMPKLDVVCRFGGHADCAAILGLGEGFAGELVFAGPHGIFVSAGFGRMGAASRLAVTVDAYCGAYLGQGVTSADSRWQVEGDQSTPCALMVGDDAMIASDVCGRNFDSHAIIDIESLAVINAPGSVILGPHCWIGQNVRIARALRIGTGSIVDLGAIVTSDIGDYVAAGGAPAQVLREGVTWDRRRKPSAEQIRAVLDAN